VGVSSGVVCVGGRAAYNYHSSCCHFGSRGKAGKS
jgi:hypothetical protein